MLKVEPDGTVTLAGFSFARFRDEQWRVLENQVRCLREEAARESLSHAPLCGPALAEKIVAEIRGAIVTLGDVGDYIASESGFRAALLCALRVRRPTAAMDDVERLRFPRNDAAELMRWLIGLADLPPREPSADPTVNQGATAGSQASAAS